MIYGYVRVSTRGQAKEGNSMEAQEEILRNAGATIIYKEAFTGTAKNRPQFNELLGQVKEGDRIIVTKLDRLARSASKGSSIVKELLERGVSVQIVNMGLVDNTPTGRLILNILFAFAEFERDMIVERTSEGKAIARKSPDFREGRPKKFTKKQMEHALLLLKENTYKQVTEMTGISKSTLIRANRINIYEEQMEGV